MYRPYYGIYYQNENNSWKSRARARESLVKIYNHVDFLFQNFSFQPIFGIEITFQDFT